MNVSDQRTDWVCAQVIKQEFACKPSLITELLNEDEDFVVELSDAVSRIIRDPRNMMNLHRVLIAFDHAIERKAGAEWDEWNNPYLRKETTAREEALMLERGL